MIPARTSRSFFTHGKQFAAQIFIQSHISVISYRGITSVTPKSISFISVINGELLVVARYAVALCVSVVNF